MPIDASIPLQAKNPQIESPMNQLAMMSDAMKIGEYQRSSQEQNQLRDLIRSGVDMKSPEFVRKAYEVSPALGMKVEETQAKNIKLGLEGRKLQSEVDTSEFKLTRDKTNNAILTIANFDTPQAALDDLSRRVKAGEIPLEVGQQHARQIQSMPWQQYKTNTIQSLLTAYERTQSENTKRGQNLTDARAREVQNRPQYIQTDAGLVAVPNVLKPGQAPVGVPVMGASGENLGKPLKDIPATVNKAIIENDISMNKANRALDLLQGKDVTTPKGDVIKGSADATGFWKGLTPQVILNKWDPGGVSTRAFVADIGSLKVHDRSGAAVTASETPRLKPFIPSIYDAPDVAAEKLVNFKAEYEDIQRGLTETYSREQGYRPSPVLTGKGGSSGGNNTPRKSLNDIFAQ
jgi:hypothetical protein